MRAPQSSGAPKSFHHCAIDIAGQKFGRLTAIEHAAQRTNSGAIKWRCRCDCGKDAFVTTARLRNGNTISCGCARDEKVAKVNRKHGRCKTPEYGLWASMKRRCHASKAINYERYGARGIYVCDRWKHDFAAFFADVGPRPDPKLQLDRIDNDGPYAPGNVKWSTRSEQMRNRRRWSKKKAGAA